MAAKENPQCKKLEIVIVGHTPQVVVHKLQDPTLAMDHQAPNRLVPRYQARTYYGRAKLRLPRLLPDQRA